MLSLMALSACNETSKNTELVVDLAAVARALGRDDVMTQKLDQARNTLNTQLLKIGEDLEQQLKQKKDELEKASKKDKPAGEKELGEMTRKANAQLKQTQQLARQKASTFRDKLIQDFREEVMDAAGGIAENRGASSVVAAGAHLLWYDSRNDITDEVIGVMRDSAKQPAEPKKESE